jgi:hypothetical protein
MTPEIEALLERLRDRAHFVMNEGIESAATALDQAADIIEALTRERDAMAEALARYGQHDRNCLARKGAHYGDEHCDCGYLAVFTPTDEQEKG